MFDPIEFETDKLLIHSFRPQDIQGIDNMANDIFDILTDDQTLKFLPQKRIGSISDSLQLLKNNILSFYAAKNYLHFIKVKSTSRIIGAIDVITPKMAREHYRISGGYPYFIEFYLKSSKVKQGIMSELLPSFISTLHHRKINNVAAIINRENLPAKKVLEKAGFQYLSKFDPLQDYYTITLTQINENTGISGRN